MERKKDVNRYFRKRKSKQDRKKGENEERKKIENTDILLFLISQIIFDSDRYNCV